MLLRPPPRERFRTPRHLSRHPVPYSKFLSPLTFYNGLSFLQLTLEPQTKPSRAETRRIIIPRLLFVASKHRTPSLFHADEKPPVWLARGPKCSSAPCQLALYNCPCMLGQISPPLSVSLAGMNLKHPGEEGLHAILQSEPLSTPDSSGYDRATHPSSNPKPWKRLHSTPTPASRRWEHYVLLGDRRRIGLEVFARVKAYQRMPFLTANTNAGIQNHEEERILFLHT